MMAEIRLYKKSKKEYFDIEYFWIYEWVSTIENDSVELIKMLKDLRRFYGHICSKAKRPLNVRGRANQKTSFRVRDRFRKSFERELVKRGMKSTFKITRRKSKDDNIYLSLNNSLNQALDVSRRKEFAASASHEEK
jgi:hypothetical protein